MADLRERIFVAFDTETTGLAPQTSKVVEIAGVRFTGAGNEIGRFATLANPGMSIAPEVTEIHGIDDGMVAHAPDPIDACRQFFSWVGEDDILIAHNAAFDVTFISAELARGHRHCPKNTVLDTLRLMKSMKLAIINHRLQTLVEFFELPTTSYHRAMADSLHVKELFLKYLEYNDGIAVDHLADISAVDSVYDMVSGQLDVMPRFAQLSEMIEQAVILNMRYDGTDSRSGYDRILPLNVCNIGGDDYLVGQCMHDGRVKQFRLDRIIDIGPDVDRGAARRIV